METDLLIIGAGPFGLAVAAQASHDRIDHVVVGKPMEFWRTNMPKGMFLRSDCEWHLDPLNVHTIEAFLQSQRKTAKDVEPLSLDFYLEYADWFQKQKAIHPQPVYIQRLDRSVANEHFAAITRSGDVIKAKNVVLAPGFRHFANTPDELKARLPADSWVHTCEFVDLSNATNKRYLIIGGRQSAFEWAALLLEAGASAVHLSHRHPSPAFTVSEWSWVGPLVEGMAKNPKWFRQLSEAEKEAVSHRQWAEGRLKVEPWLEPRLQDKRVHIWPETEVVRVERSNDSSLLVDLTNDQKLHVDQIVLATGYKVDIARLPIFKDTNILAQIETRNGFPVLDEHLQTTIPGLFITSMPAMQDFGPFFGFTVAVRTSAKLICQELRVRTERDVSASN